MKSQLENLIGKKVIRLDRQLDQVISINASVPQNSIDLFTQIYFDDYVLNIYNRFKLLNSSSLEELQGLSIKKVLENKNEILLEFET